MISIGTKDIQDITVGTKQIQEISIGNVVIWSAK